MPATLLLHVSQILAATPRSRRVRLELAGNRFQFAAGQAVFVRAPGGATAYPYSITAAPDDVARDGFLELLVGDTSGGVDQLLRVGTPVEVYGPVGEFTLTGLPSDSPLVFIAGGRGIAPLRSMIREASTRGSARISVVHSARTPQELAYSDEWRALATSGRIAWYPKVTRVEYQDAWNGARGRIEWHDLRGVAHSPSTHCLLCGPPAMVAAIQSQLVSGGISPARIHVERVTTTEPCLGT